MGLQPPKAHEHPPRVGHPSRVTLRLPNQLAVYEREVKPAWGCLLDPSLLVLANPARARSPVIATHSVSRPTWTSPSRRN